MAHNQVQTHEKLVLSFCLFKSTIMTECGQFAHVQFVGMIIHSVGVNTQFNLTATLHA